MDRDDLGRHVLDATAAQGLDIVELVNAANAIAMALATSYEDPEMLRPVEEYEDAADLVERVKNNAAPYQVGMEVIADVIADGPTAAGIVMVALAHRFAEACHLLAQKYGEDTGDPASLVDIASVIVQMDQQGGPSAHLRDLQNPNPNPNKEQQ